MDLLLLDKNFEICGIIDDFSSLVWNRNYYKVGNFTLTTDLKSLSQFENARYIYSKDLTEVGILETMQFQHNENGITITRTGRFLESILNNRVILPTQNFSSKTTEYICRSLVTSQCISPTDTDRTISNLILGTDHSLGTSRTLQVTGKSLLDYMYDLCKEDEISLRLTYDYDNQRLVFENWQGKDRRDTQSTNSWAIFSRNFENIQSDEYNEDSTQYCNFAYVEGESSNGTRVEVEVDHVGTGEERRELYVDARDLQSEDIGQTQYEDALKQRGEEKLKEQNKVEQVTFEVDTGSNLKYKVDYDLGDLVVYKSTELGMIIENRIVGITEARENGVLTIAPTFGDTYNIKKGVII